MQQYLGAAIDVATTLTLAPNLRSPWAKLGLAVKLGARLYETRNSMKLHEQNEVEHESLFWKFQQNVDYMLLPWSLSDHIKPAIAIDRDSPLSGRRWSNIHKEWGRAFRASIQGIPLVVLVTLKSTPIVEHVFIDSNDEDVLDRLVALVADQMWADYSFGQLDARNGRPVEKVPINKDKMLPSALHKQFNKRFLPAFKAGASRSFIIAGEPGVGKSTAVQLALQEAGARTVHLARNSVTGGPGHIDELRGNTSPSAKDYLRLWRPDAFVIDDVDRYSSEVQAQLLSFIDEAMRTPRPTWVFMTVNHPEDVIPPLRRAGRGGDWIEAAGLDPDTLDMLLGPMLAGFTTRCLRAGFTIGAAVDFVERVGLYSDAEAEYKSVDFVLQSQRAEYARRRNAPATPPAADGIFGEEGIAEDAAALAAPRVR